MKTVHASASESLVQVRRRLRWPLAVSAVLVLLAVLLGAMYFHTPAIPADLDLATARRTEQGRYQVSYTPHSEAIRLNTLHSWTLHVETADGRPVADASISVDGDMPQHGHGLPTQPQMTHYLGNGDYRIDGMKFQMGGWWVVDFTIDAHGQHDRVRFNVILE